MNKFIRFIVLLLVLGVFLAVSLVMFMGIRSERKRQHSLEVERQSLGDHLLTIQDDLHRLEFIVEHQQVGGDNEVISTTYLIFPYGIDARGQSFELPPWRRETKGHRLLIDGYNIELPAGIIDAQFPQRQADNVTHQSMPLALPVFGHVYPSETTPTEADLLVPWGQVPPGYRPESRPSSEFEQQIWRRVGEYMTNKLLQERSHVKVTDFSPVEITLKPGVISQVFLGRSLQLRVGQMEDTQRVKKMLKQAPPLPGATTAPVGD